MWIITFWLKRAKSDNPHYMSGPAIIALAHIILKENDDALHWLNLAYQEKSIDLPVLIRYPEFALLKDDLRFKELKIKMNIPD